MTSGIVAGEKDMPDSPAPPPMVIDPTSEIHIRAIGELFIRGEPGALIVEHVKKTSGIKDFSRNDLTHALGRAAVRQALEAMYDVERVETAYRAMGSRKQGNSNKLSSPGPSLRKF